MDSTNDPWPQIVQDALNKGLVVSRGAVAGAKLRQLIADAARRDGQPYPPPGREDEKFTDFLKSFSSLLIVLRREGRDILVAPADRPDLLEKEGEFAFLREDIFEAFTRISRAVPPEEAWYERTTDTIQWTTADKPLDPTRFVKIPPPTQSKEIQDRSSFASQPGMEKHRVSLLATLGEHHALWTFSKIVKERGLGRDWHAYRLQNIVKQIRAWCHTNQVEWRDNWFRPTTTGAADSIKLARMSVIPDDKRLSVAKFIEGLSEDDLRRVAIPLDLVLKLLQQ